MTAAKRNMNASGEYHLYVAEFDLWY